MDDHYDLKRLAFIHNAFHLIGVTILLFDYVITLPLEIKLMWTQPCSRFTMWFYLNRYWSLVGTIAVAATLFLNLGDSSCHSYGIVREVVIMGGQVLVAIILSMRMYAFYQRDTKIRNLLGLCAAVFIIMAIGSVQGEHVVAFDVLHCATSTVDQGTSVRTAVSWWAVFGMDTFICVLTVVRSFQLARVTCEVSHGAVAFDIISLMLRDGLLYYGAISLVTLCNIVTFYLDVPYLPGTLSTIAGSVSVSMCSRMVLNLRERGVVHASGEGLVDGCTTAAPETRIRPIMTSFIQPVRPSESYVRTLVASRKDLDTDTELGLPRQAGSVEIRPRESAAELEMREMPRSQKRWEACEHNS